jgi:hypothetical protein
MNKKTEDLKFGNENEKIVLSKLRDYFKSKNINKIKYNMDTFDFIDKDNKLIFELKSRRINKNQYYDTMIGYNKIIDGFKHIDKGYKVYLCWKYLDKLCYYELTKDSYNEKWKRMGGRVDRNKDERHLCYFVPTKEMTEII